MDLISFLSCAGWLVAGAGPAATARPVDVVVDVAPVRFVVSVGNNQGSDGEEDLRFAESDARRFGSLWAGFGATSPEHVYLLVDKGPDDVLAALADVGQKVARLRSQGRSAQLFFYYAGHGDDASLHLGAAVLLLKDLEQAVANLPIDLRVVFVDACRSAGGSRSRGVSVGQPFDVVVDFAETTGSVVISSASPGEPAQESDELGGAVFSHYLFSGLSGAADSNGDGRVSLSEAYEFAHDKTLMRTGLSRAPLQRPSYNVEVTGSGSVILTWPAKAEARVVLPMEPDARVLVFTLPTGLLVAEAATRREREVVLGLPRGRYSLQCHSPSGAGEVSVELPWGGERRLDAAVCRQTAKLAGNRRRGGTAHNERWTVGLEGLGTAWPTRKSSSGVGLSIGVERAAGFALGLRADWGRVALAWDAYNGSEHSLTLTPYAGYQRLGEWYSVSVGAGPLLGLVVQRLERPEAERVDAAGLRAKKTRQAMSIGPAALALFRMELGNGLAATASARLEIDFVRTRTAAGAPSVAGYPAGMIGIGIAYAF